VAAEEEGGGGSGLNDASGGGGEGQRGWGGVGMAGVWVGASKSSASCSSARRGSRLRSGVRCSADAPSSSYSCRHARQPNSAESPTHTPHLVRVRSIGS
jgi:hypothetical protein